MRRPVITLFLLLIVAGCAAPAPDPALVQQIVKDTQAAIPTQTPYPTNTPKPTITPTPTRTPAPTRTPRPYEDFYSYINKFGEIFNQVTKLRNESDEIKLHDIYFEKIDNKTTLFISLKNVPSRITDGSVLALPVTLIEDVRDNRKADLPKDIDMVVITSFNMESVKKLTINIKWSDLAEYADGDITFDQLFTRIEQTPH